MHKVTFLITLFLFSIIVTAQNTAEDIKSSVTVFVKSLSEDQRKIVVHDFNDSARLKWNNLPVGLRARAGIQLGSLTDEQRKQVHRILSAALSSQGYLKATGIMHLDNLLNMYYDTLLQRKQINADIHKRMRELQWSTQNFFLAVFNQPTDSIWGFKLEGHHLSLNFTFTKNQVAITPMFVGTDPAEYPTSEYAGWRVLGQEEDLGIKLVNILSPQQKKEGNHQRQGARRYFYCCRKRQTFA